MMILIGAILLHVGAAAQPVYDLLLQGGYVIDPYNQTNEPRMSTANPAAQINDSGRRARFTISVLFLVSVEGGQRRELTAQL